MLIVDRSTVARAAMDSGESGSFCIHQSPMPRPGDHSAGRPPFRPADRFPSSRRREGGRREGDRPRRRFSVRIDTSARPLDIAYSASSLPVVTVRTSAPFPNVFRKRIATIPDGLEPGALVAVNGPDGERLGYGYFNPAAEISLRIIRWGEAPPDDAFWDQTLDRALSLRHELLTLPDSTTAMRVIHAEGDFLPGLVVDRYDDVLSIEAFSLAMFQRAEALTQRLAEFCGTKHFIIRTSPHSEEQEGFDAPPVRSPGLPSSVVIQEYGTRFRVSFEEGHKTGFFCDQRDNRQKLASYCAGRSVADICCYTGGFAVQAKVLGKAADVTAIDLDEKPLQLAKANANLNQARINCVQADAFAWMRDMVRNGRQFDVLVLDPPKLIHSHAEIEEGRKKHFDLNRLAMQLVKPGGLMLSCTCSGLLDRTEFDKLLCAASRQAGPPLPGQEESEFPRRQPRDMQIIDRTGAGSDHPIAANCPEGDYLKATWMRLM